MTKAYTITLSNDDARVKARSAIRRAPDGYRVTFEEPKRTNAQNDRLHVMIRDVARQVEYYGKKRDEDFWKQLFVGAFRKSEMVPCLSGDGFTEIRPRTSKMKKADLSDLMMLIEEYGARHGVTFKEAA